MATIYYRVKARNTSGDSSASNSDSVVITEVPADAPTNPTATPLSESSMQISFGLVADADKYLVYRSTSPGFTPGVGNKLSTEPTSSPFTDSASMSPNTNYYYVIWASNTGDDLAPNPSVEFSGATDLISPASFTATQNYGFCPTIVFDLSWSNANTDGDIRSETMTIQWYNGSAWTTLSSSLTAGSTSYQATVTSSVTQFRIKYNSESTYSTDVVLDTTCPE